MGGGSALAAGGGALAEAGAMGAGAFAAAAMAAAALVRATPASRRAEALGAALASALVAGFDAAPLATLATTDADDDDAADADADGDVTNVERASEGSGGGAATTDGGEISARTYATPPILQP